MDQENQNGTIPQDPQTPHLPPPDGSVIQDQPNPVAANSQPSLKHKRLILFLVTVGVLILVAGLAFWLTSRNHQSQPITKPYSGPVDKIRVGNVGEYSIFNLIAKDKGYFVQNGLDTTITEYASGPPAVADLLANKVDFAIGADFVGVNNIFGNKDLGILAQISDQDVFRIIGLKDKGINKPADLKGKKVEVTLKGAGEFLLGRFLNLNGLKLSDITEVDSTPVEMIKDINSAKTDAIVIFEPHVYNLQQKLGSKVVSWSVQGDLKTSGLSYSTSSYINAHPDVVRRYLRSLVQAESFLNQNDQEAKNILANSLNYSSGYVNYLWPKINFAISLNQELLLNMEDEARFVIASKGTTQTKVPNYLDYIYFAGLEKVKPDAITIIH